jgi:Uma2 family endonuclease
MSQPGTVQPLSVDDEWILHVKPHPGRRLTEEEFLAWAGDDTLAEWVDGEVIMMSPVSDDHDDYQFWLRTVAYRFVKRRRLGRLKGPEFMIRFGGLPRAWRAPDVLFVAASRVHLIKRNCVEGPPDLVIEVVSPDSRKRDWEEKFAEYAAVGVREYWVLDRERSRVEAFGLGEGGSYRRIEPEDGEIRSAVLPGFYLRVEWLLAAEPPDEDEVLRELLGA